MSSWPSQDSIPLNPPLAEPAPPAGEGKEPVSPALRDMLRDVLETLLFTLLIFFLVRSVVQNFRVDGSSMEPTLHTGQYIMVNRLIYAHIDLNLFSRRLPGGEKEPHLAYLFHLPRRGDIVVFEYPRDTSRDFIKRVIGLPGETVEVRNNQVYINGVPLEEPYLSDTAKRQMGHMAPVQVPPGAVFVMGDNRGNSSDSRNWGPLPLDRIVGKAWFTYWPAEQWGQIPSSEPILAAP